MRFITVTLDATDTAKTIATLASLTEKKSHISTIVIYAESGNNVSSARIGGSDVDRLPAVGMPLPAGEIQDRYFPPQQGGIYNFDHIWIVGETGDIFQIGYTII